MSNTTYETFERDGQHYVRGQRHDIPADTWAELLKAIRRLKEAATE